MLLSFVELWRIDIYLAAQNYFFLQICLFFFYIAKSNTRSNYKLITKNKNRDTHTSRKNIKKISQIFFNANKHSVLFKQRLSFYIGFITVFSVNKEIPATLFLIAASCFIWNFITHLTDQFLMFGCLDFQLFTNIFAWNIQ